MIPLQLVEPQGMYKEQLWNQTGGPRQYLKLMYHTHDILNIYTAASCWNDNQLTVHLEQRNRNVHIHFKYILKAWIHEYNNTPTNWRNAIFCEGTLHPRKHDVVVNISCIVNNKFSSLHLNKKHTNKNMMSIRERETFWYSDVWHQKRKKKNENCGLTIGRKRKFSDVVSKYPNILGWVREDVACLVAQAIIPLSFCLLVPIADFNNDSMDLVSLKLHSRKSTPPTLLRAS